MVAVDRAVIARLKKAGRHFEILVDCDNALAFKQGKAIPLEDILATEDVYFNVKKGEKVSEGDLRAAFDTDDVRKAITQILLKGEIQHTAKHRDEERETKKKQLVNIIHTNAVDSKTGYPHPLERIATALEQSKFRFDDDKRAEDQVDDALSALRELLPIKFEKKDIAITVAASYAGQAKGVVHKHHVIKEDWLDNGAYTATVRLPAGLVDDFFATLNAITHGDVESTILQTID